MRVLVTGATGFLGAHVVELLVRREHLVRGVVRASSNVRALVDRGVECVIASLETGEGLEGALDEIDAVIHLAGGGRVISPDAFFRQNTLTTTTLIDAITRHRSGLRRFVLASSISAAPGATHHDVDQGNRLDPPARSQYGKAKRAAEDAALMVSAEVPTTIVRLPALYGPGDTRWLAVFRMAAHGWLPTLGATAPMSMLYATDAATAMVRPIEVNHASGSIFSPDDGEPHTQEQLGRIIADALGTKPRVIRISPRVLTAAATVSEWLGARTGTSVFLTHDKVRDLMGDGWACDSVPIRREIGWRSEVDLLDGARRTARWALSEGLL